MNWGWYPRRREKKPAPTHGVKIKKMGTTWWGQRWIEALEAVLQGDSGRLARGRTYARAGRAHDFIAREGKIHAQVTGSSPRPYRVTIALAPLSDSEWKKAITAMAEQAQFAAELLAGKMPKEIDVAFHAGGTSLFPVARKDLVTSCTCPDWGDPCKHVAAVHYVLGDALERDPFLLFELRGRTKSQVLEALRAARGNEETVARTEGIRSVKLGKMKPADYERASLPAMHFSFDAPQKNASAVLKQLGAPSGWTLGMPPSEAFGTLIRAAAETARRIAMAEPESELEGSSAKPKKRSVKKRPR